MRENTRTRISGDTRTVKTIGLALIALALAIAGAWAYAEIAEADGELDSSGRRIDCIPRDHANPSGACLWTPELTKVEVRVEFKYPYCEMKLDVENNLDELPEGVVSGSVYLVHILPDGSSYRLLDGGRMYARHPDWGVTHYASRIPGYSNSHHPVRYKHDEINWFTDLKNAVQRALPQTTLGKIALRAGLVYSGEFAEHKRVGNALRTHAQVSPQTVQSNAIPISHTFAGLVEEMFTCLEVAKREEERVSERVELEAQKAGLRQSLTLLESELARARRHELDATTILKEVIDVSARVDEMLRTIQRVRVEGLAERRKIIERYYSEESRRYSVFIRSLESSRAALAAADEAIAAHKAELERSRASLEALVSSAQAAEAELIAEIEEAREALGDDGGD